MNDMSASEFETWYNLKKTSITVKRLASLSLSVHVLLLEDSSRPPVCKESREARSDVHAHA